MSRGAIASEARAQISRIRRGGRASPKTAEALAEVTGIPAADFVFRPDVADLIATAAEHAPAAEACA